MFNITSLNTHPNKDTNLNAKEQCCSTGNDPKNKIFLIYMP
jgi:hypothetical protein